MKTINMPSTRRSFLALAGAATVAAYVTPAVAQDDYPSRPVRLYAPSAGGSGDWAARALAAGLEKELGQQVVVENKPNVVGVELTADAKPDGYTLLFYGSGLWMFPLLNPDAKFDPVKDFQPISLVATSPSMIAVNPSLGVKTVKELIDLAKAEPGKLNFSAGQIGSANHLAAELFKSMADVDMTYVAYKGTGEAITSTVAGETQVAFLTVDVAAQHIQSGRLIPLAVLSDTRSELAPGVPTVAESGVPGYEASTKQVLWAPAGLPKPILDKLNKAAVKILSEGETKKAFLDRGSETNPSTPDDVTAKMKDELAKWGKILAERPEILNKK